MRIGPIDLERDILVVAEIGNNHEGDFDLACEMVRQAARAGVGAVKFQSFIPEEYVSSDQAERMRMLHRFRLSLEQFERLAGLAGSLGLVFLSTPFDPATARGLTSFVPAFKIASADITFLPLLEAVARSGKPVILSTGLASLEEVTAARDFIRSCWSALGITQELAALHCVSCYPTPPEEANLAAIRTLASLGVTPGYSDHTLGIEAAVLAVGLGARIIEKHFTLDKHASSFRDHRLSADPGEMALLVGKVREASAMLGSGVKESATCEKDAVRALRRSIALNRDLPAGSVLKSGHFRWVRPGTGFAPGMENALAGKRLARNVAVGVLLSPEDLADA